MPKNKARHASTNSQSVSEDEMESSGEDGFRVHVDLSAYWGAPAACLLWAGRGERARRVRHLARRLAAAAALRRPFCLLAAGAALAPADPLCLLRPDDQLRVVPVEHEWQKPFSFCEEDDAASSPAPRLGDAAPPPPPPARAPVTTSVSRSDDDSLSPVLMDSTSAADHLSHDTSLVLTESKPTPVSTLRPGTAASMSDECGDAALQGVKRRALALLARAAAGAGCEGAGDEADGVPARKRRRRVRRRRPAREPAWEPEPEPEPPSTPGASPDPPAPAEPLASAHQTFQSPGPPPPPPPPPAPVRRNEGDEGPPRAPRPPRLVRALPAPSPAPDNTPPPATLINI